MGLLSFCAPAGRKNCSRTMSLLFSTALSL